MEDIELDIEQEEISEEEVDEFFSDDDAEDDDIDEGLKDLVVMDDIEEENN